MISNRKARLLAVLVVGEVIAARLAWRDLDHRADSAVRGKKKIWRAAILANPGNSLAYWTFGRR